MIEQTAGDKIVYQTWQVHRLRPLSPVRWRHKYNMLYSIWGEIDFMIRNMQIIDSRWNLSKFSSVKKLVSFKICLQKFVVNFAVPKNISERISQGSIFHGEKFETNHSQMDGNESKISTFRSSKLWVHLYKELTK